MIKADLKHWGGRRGANGPYEIDYGRFVEQAYHKLGKGGVVGIPNARGSDNPLGAEYRFEELYEIAEKSENPIKKLNDGRVFHDEKYDIWFVKSQEVNTTLPNNKKLTYLVFNLPFGENFKEKDPSSLSPFTINILTAPSCADSLNFLDEEYLEYFNGIIVHSSSAVVRKGANKSSDDFYNKHVRGKSFGFGRRHSIGAIAVSGGHRSPRENLLQKIVSPVSIGSSYTFFTKFEGKILEDFNDWLRASVEASQESQLVKGSTRRETLFRHLPRMIQGVLSGERKGVF